MIRRLALAVALVTVVSITAGAAAVLPIGDSAPLQVIETDTPPLVPTTVPPDTDPGDGETGQGSKVWVCVMLVDHHGQVTPKPGKNPIEVSVNSNNAREATDAEHPSYLAVDGNEACQAP